VAADRSVYVYDPVDEPVDWLTERGVTVTLGAPLRNTGRSRPKITEAELIAGARNHAALLGASGTLVTKRVIENLPDLRFIVKLGIGYEVIDIEAATERGIWVTNTPMHSEVVPVAEHAIALMLALAKRLHAYTADYVRAGGWRNPDQMAISIDQKTIGIVGLGNIGREVARRLAGWNARLIATDIRPVSPPDGVELTDLDTLLATADIVTLHVPGRSQSEGPLLDQTRLEAMKPGALLVNTARGNLVDIKALAERLRDGHLGGAAVDVYSPEPPRPDDPLLKAPNVLATPHTAAWNTNVRKEMAAMAFRDLWTMLSGGVPEHLVNPEVLTR
jgi:D-3-phosphoglycerate dehydrogenase / 2-oxoglutarate reductase